MESGDRQKNFFFQKRPLACICRCQWYHRAYQTKRYSQFLVPLNRNEDMADNHWRQNGTYGYQVTTDNLTFDVLKEFICIDHQKNVILEIKHSFTLVSVTTIILSFFPWHRNMVAVAHLCTYLGGMREKNFRVKFNSSAS